MVVRSVISAWEKSLVEKYLRGEDLESKELDGLRSLRFRLKKNWPLIRADCALLERFIKKREKEEGKRFF